VFPGYPGLLTGNHHLPIYGGIEIRNRHLSAVRLADRETKEK